MAKPLNSGYVGHKMSKRGYSWESNPWVWVLTFKVIGGEAE